LPYAAVLLLNEILQNNAPQEQQKKSSQVFQPDPTPRHAKALDSKPVRAVSNCQDDVYNFDREDAL
jgi:hypothetical protein